MHKPSLPENPTNLRWWSDPRALVRYVLSLDDTPHHIALGTAVGMFIGLTPTGGIQMILVMVVYALVSWFMRFNCKAALVAVYVSNPLTGIPILWLEFVVGQRFIGSSITWSEVLQILKTDGYAHWWSATMTLFLELGWTLIVGSIIVGALAAAITYPATLALAQFVHKRSSRSTEESATAESDEAVPAGQEIAKVGQGEAGERGRRAKEGV